MNEPNLPKDITHFVFTDYSGDDGRKFDRGSSATLTLAIAISHRDDYAFNEDLVFQVKRLLGIKASDELKFTTLKRHKKRSKALRILEQAKIQLCIIHVLKKLEPDDDPMSIIVANTFPMTAVASEILRQDENSKIQVVFDQTQSGMWDRFIRDMLSRKTEFQGADIRPGTPDCSETSWRALETGYRAHFVWQGQILHFAASSERVDSFQGAQ
jgi:hypothetical protein